MFTLDEIGWLVGNQVDPDEALALIVIFVADQPVLFKCHSVTSLELVN
jgi:hypothetical protein